MQPITYQNTLTNICMAILIKEGAIQFQYLEGIVSNCLPSGESYNIGQAPNSSNKKFRYACAQVRLHLHGKVNDCDSRITMKRGKSELFTYLIIQSQNIYLFIISHDCKETNLRLLNT